MGYLFGLARMIDPRIRYTMDISTLIGLIYIAKCSLSLFGSIFNGQCPVCSPVFASNSQRALCEVIRKRKILLSFQFFCHF